MSVDLLGWLLIVVAGALALLLVAAMAIAAAARDRRLHRGRLEIVEKAADVTAGTASPGFFATYPVES